MAPQKLILGRIINPISDYKAEFYINGAMLLEQYPDKKGYFIKKLADRSAFSTYKGKRIDYSDRVIIPSFFDMHFHWVQDDVRQMPKDSLLSWLEKYTFPAEDKFKDKKYSQKKANVFFKRLTKSGTLGGACFSSVHENALKDAFDNVKGDFVIGNVLMTMNSPAYLVQSKKNALSLVKKSISKYKKKYAVTPRFAISTDPETMKETHQLARKHQLFIQSHLSENTDEIKFVLSLYKKLKGFRHIKTYTDIYKKVGALGKRSLMAHGIHLSAAELAVLSNSKTTLVHCPTSNAPKRQKGLGSGLFDFKKVEKHKVSWVLGSDIGGGPILSMFDVMQSFVSQNKKKKEATYCKALYRSTLASATVLELEKTHGNFQKNKWANFCVLKQQRNFKKDTAETVLKRICQKYKSNRDNYDHLVDDVFYKGQKLT